MSNTIKVAAGFSVGNNEAIDDRLVVDTIAERNSILSYRRYIGLETIVRDGGSGTLKKYRLEGGITNTDWKDISENGVIETRDTNAIANTIPLRDSNGNFQIKLAQDKIFVGNTFGNAEQRTLPYSLTGQAGKAITVKSDLSGYEYTSFPTGSLNNVTVKSGVTGLTATKTGDNVELDASYPSTLVQSATGYQVLKSISSNKLLGATLVQGSNITISETDGEAIEGLVTKRLTISGASGDWNSLSSKPEWTGYMPVSTLLGQANKLIGVNSAETGYEYKTFDASTISYHNVTYNTVEKALDKLLYVPVTVGISGGGTYEIGTTINTVNLTWSTNKDITTQSINNGIGSLAPEVRNYTHSGQTITSNRTYTITVNDGTQNGTSSTTVAFMYKRYCGTSSNTSLNNSQILALGSEFSSTRVQNRTFDCTGGTYFYIVYPASWGTATFKVGGLSFSDMILSTQTITNAVGASVLVYVYRVNNIQTGSAINVEVL